MIPEGWSVQPLSSLANVERGKFTARPRNNPKLYGGNIPFVQTGDIRSAAGWLKSYSQTLNDDGLAVSRIFPAGTILITIAANIGDVAIATFPVACPDSIVAVQTMKDVSNTWLMYTLQTRKNDLDALSTQNAQKNINLEILRPFEILTPPLEEQRKIAAILSTWDEAIGLVEQLIAALGRRKQALMQLLLTGAVRFAGFEGEWEEVELANCSIGKPQYGANASAIDFDPDLPRYIRITDISEDGQLYTDGKVSIELNGNERYVLKDNDFLFARSGATVGKTYLYQSSDGLAIYAGYLIKFVIDENKLIAQYLKHFTQSPIYYEWVKNTLRAGAQPNINAQEYASLPLGLSSTVEQQQIAEVLNTSDAFINLYREHADKLREQKRGLMQQLLTGAVRV